MSVQPVSKGFHAAALLEGKSRPHPLRRIATLDEMLGLVCFLAGTNVGYMTDGVIDVAGGLGV